MREVLNYAVMTFAVGYMVWTVWRYFNLKKSAKFVDNETFSSLMRTGQVIDIREPASFRRKHILGARNFPMMQFTMSLSALRKDKPVLLYDARRGVGTTRAIQHLKKAGFTDIYVLKDGLEFWDGKVKETV